MLGDGLSASRRPPIFLVGIPRTGSSWVGTLLSTAAGVQYFREPFNMTHRADAKPFHLRYLRSEDEDPAFDAYCRQAFSRELRGEKLEQHAWGVYARFRWWPGRLLIKEVHTGLALERIERLAQPCVIIIIRHPGAVAASWARLRKLYPHDPHWGSTREQLDTLLDQPALMHDHLAPFECAIRDAGTYFEQVGALWGAFYQTLLEQQESHSDRIVLHHEALCAAPRDGFGKLFQTLNLKWTSRTEAKLAGRSTRPTNPYDVHRDPAIQSDKWRRELSASEIEEVLRAARTFPLAAAEVGL